MREFLKAINDYSETSFLLFLALIAIIGVLKKKNSMKYLFILLNLILTSCTISDQEKDIRIYYQDGTTEDLTISTEHGYANQIGGKEATIYFHDGCLYKDHHESKYEANFTGCIRCGVRDYQVLAVRKIKNK